MELARLRTCIPSLLAYAIGISIGEADWGTKQYLGCIVAVLVPALANIHNAITDLEEDGNNIPGRAIAVNAARRDRILVALKIGTALILGYTFAAGWAIGLIGIVGLIALHQYSARPLRAKARPMTGGLIFVQVVALPLLAGGLTSNSWTRPNTDNLVDLWVAYALASIWFTAKFFVKNVPDFHGDKDAGLRTTATICASPKSAAALALSMTICSYIIILSFTLSSGRISLSVAVALALVVSAINGVRMYRSSNSPVTMNQTMAWDMYISIVFLASVLVIISPPAISATILTICLTILMLTEILRLDSRKKTYLTHSSLNTETGK